MYLVFDHIEYAPEKKDYGFSTGAELYIALQDRFFPAEHWYDLAFVDLKCWLPCLISFGNNHTDQCIFTFMDGPYSVILNRYNDKCITVSFLRDGTVIYSIQEINLIDFIKSVKSCCQKYDRFLYMNGKAHQFVEEIAKLKSILDTYDLGDNHV